MIDIIKKNEEKIKFLLVGLLNTLFGYVLFAFFNLLTGYYTFSLGMVYTLAIFFNYFIYSKIIFNTNKKSNLISFILVYIFFLILNISLIKFGLLFHQNEILLQGIFLPILALGLYFALKKIVFK